MTIPGEKVYEMMLDFIAYFYQKVSHDTLNFIVYDEGKQIWRVIPFLRTYIFDHEEIKITILSHFPLFNNFKATIYTLKYIEMMSDKHVL